MPRKPCYWTRKLELDLVEYVRHRDYIWRPFGNTNHHIQQKYKAYAEFAARLGRGFTARSVRDRWVNIRSTFNHNVRRVEKSKETAKSSSDIFVPCWPLWKPLQFLKEIPRKADTNSDNIHPSQHDFNDEANNLHIKEEPHSEADDLEIRRRIERTDRPRRKNKLVKNYHQKSKCNKVIDELLQALRPISKESAPEHTHWFFAKHVVGTLNSMRKIDAKCAAENIMKLLQEYHSNMELG